MTDADRRLPDGFVVRLHDDVELGAVLVAGARVMRLSGAARRMIVGRTMTVDSPTTAALADRLLDLDVADPVVDSATPRLGEVTVVVPVRDNADGVDRLLRELTGQVACVVVDDASLDPGALAGIVADRGAQLVRLDHNVGPAAARNAGAREVRTSLVAFVDSDVVVSAASLADLTRHFADPRLGAVAPRVVTDRGPRWFQRYEAAHGSLDLGPTPATLRPWSPVTYVPSACLVVRRDDLGPGFDPRLRSGEDVDLVWRLQAAGRRVRYAAEVTARHDRRATLREWLGRKALYGTSAAPLAARHGDRVAPSALTPSMAAVALGLLVRRRWSAAVVAGGLAVHWRDSTQGLADLELGSRVRVVAMTGGGMARQCLPLALRHWWPVSVALALVSARARQALVVAAVADGVWTRLSSGSDLGLLRFTLARRLDDLAYGAGVWLGVVRARSVRCLMPRWVSPRRLRAGR